MSKILRACVVATVAAVVALGAPGVAFAAGPPVHSATPAPSPTATQPKDGCLGDTDDYGVPLPCLLSVSAASICNDDVEQLQYAVHEEGVPEPLASTVNLTFTGPGGNTVTLSGLPMSGTVEWPAAVVDALRSIVQLRFQVGPTASVSAAAAPPEVACHEVPPVDPTPSPTPTPTSTPSPSSSEVLSSTPSATHAGNVVAATPASAEVLSATGSNAAPLLVGAVLLVTVGGLTLAFVARRRRSAGPAA
ncbi:hypothetical protein [Cellulomonas sp. URHB0016]